jgi:hypothetical protein
VAKKKSDPIGLSYIRTNFSVVSLNCTTVTGTGRQNLSFVFQKTFSWDVINYLHFRLGLIRLGLLG